MYIHCLDASRPTKSCLAKTATSLWSGMKTACFHFCVSTVCNPKCRNLFIPFASLQCFWFQPNLSSKELWPLPSCPCAGTWGSMCGQAPERPAKFWHVGLGLIWGNFARVAFRGHRTCDLWLLTLNVQLLLRWLRMAARLCSWSLTQRISFIFGLDPRNTCLTALCTLQPKHREGHDFLALRGISISALKFAKRAKLDECRRNIPGAQTKMGKHFYTFWQPFGLICIDIIEGLRRTYPNIRR